MFLANALKLQTKQLDEFQISDVSGLKAWYKFDTGITFDGNNRVTEWADSSGNTSEDMDLVPNSSDADANYLSNGSIEFRQANKSYLNTASDQLNLGAFTIFAVIDFDTTVSLTNEVLLGRLGNDSIRFYRGADDGRVGLRANGVISDMNNVVGDIPSDKFLMTMIRETDGDVLLRFNGTQVEDTTNAITNLFDFTQIGFGTLDADIFEVAIYNTALSGTDLTNVETNITERTGI